MSEIIKSHQYTNTINSTPCHYAPGKEDKDKTPEREMAAGDTPAPGNSEDLRDYTYAPHLPSVHLTHAGRQTKW
ncbi:hypothetical protein E2C01_098811 [Portunus trituberculatus]|uniref:Uncharacterized protein n=1 Tax=Portunus trituberculatus TaxID=210409 RepID=A0A5B7K8N6_PORTR|nr:hypothetical protein [Portunus trituberculatus]